MSPPENLGSHISPAGPEVPGVSGNRGVGVNTPNLIGNPTGPPVSVPVNSKKLLRLFDGERQRFHVREHQPSGSQSTVNIAGAKGQLECFTQAFLGDTIITIRKLPRAQPRAVLPAAS